VALTTLPAAGEFILASTFESAVTELRLLAAYNSSNQNVGPSNETLTNVTGLSLAVVASATYEFRMSLQYSTNTTADIKLAFTFPTGLTMDVAAGGFSAGGETWITTRGTQATTWTWGGTGNSAYWHGHVATGVNAGTLQLQAAQNTSTAVTTNVEAGTFMSLRRIT
jgi:hypothetical protein